MQIGIFNFGPIVVFRWQNEENWPVLEVSHNAGLVLGYADQQFLSQQLAYADIIHPMDLPRVLEEVQTFSDKGVLHFRHEPYRIIKANGDVIWVDDYTTVVRNEQNQIIEYIGYIIDATQRIRDEQELKETKARFDTIIKATGEGIWDWDIRTDQIYYSKRWKAMLGYQEDEIGQSLDEWETRIHPEDVEACKQAIQSHLYGETETYSNMHRMQHKHGHYIWILDQGKRILDEKGEAYRMIGTHKDITTELQLKNKLQESAITDALTGLLNRAEFDRLSRREIERSERYQYPVSFMMLDLDDFKQTNDCFGHQAGDDVLIILADILKSTLRASDIIGRFGGEEFIVMLPQTTCEEAQQLAERIRVLLEEEEFHFSPIANPELSEKHQQTVSIGIANHVTSEKLEQTIHFADEALYAAKHGGKNQVVGRCQQSQ